MLILTTITLTAHWILVILALAGYIPAPALPSRVILAYSAVTVILTPLLVTLMWIERIRYSRSPRSVSARNALALAHSLAPLAPAPSAPAPALDRDILSYPSLTSKTVRSAVLRDILAYLSDRGIWYSYSPINNDREFYSLTTPAGSWIQYERSRAPLAPLAPRIPRGWDSV